MPKSSPLPEESAVPAAAADLAQKRGERLKAWMTQKEIRNSDLARLSGLKEAAISKYVRGITDIGAMQPPSITKLLDAMYVSDAWAWKEFLIPEEQRSTWRSLRPPPMGPPTGTEELIPHRVETTIKGEWFIPAPAVIMINPNSRSGLLLAQLGDRYWLASQEELPPSAIILGAFESAAPASA